MKQFLSVVLLFLSLNAVAQTAEELHETGKTFMLQGDYSNAELVLNRAHQMKPNDASISRDLAFTFYLKKDFPGAEKLIKPIVEREDADEQVFQIAGNIYLAMNDNKECERIYKKGIKKFPGNGPLYNDYGELLLSQNNIEAVKQWETGIEKDPNFSGNYYHLSKFYFNRADYAWSILYGEIFLNLESLTIRTTETKGLLLEAYKKLFNTADLVKTYGAVTKNEFEKAWISCMNKQAFIASSGVGTETLVMIRTRFILDWFANYAEKFPFKLFDQHKDLLQQGLFESYNQWLFGIASDINQFQAWTNLHKEEYAEFTRLQRSRLFRIPEGQYYQGK